MNINWMETIRMCLVFPQDCFLIFVSITKKKKMTYAMFFSSCRLIHVRLYLPNFRSFSDYFFLIERLIIERGCASFLPQCINANAVFIIMLHVMSLQLFFSTCKALHFMYLIYMKYELVHVHMHTHSQSRDNSDNQK